MFIMIGGACFLVSYPDPDPTAAGGIHHRYVAVM